MILYLARFAFRAFHSPYFLFPKRLVKFEIWYDDFLLSQNQNRNYIQMWQIRLCLQVHLNKVKLCQGQIMSRSNEVKVKSGSSRGQILPSSFRIVRLANWINRLWSISWSDRVKSSIMPRNLWVVNRDCSSCFRNRPRSRDWLCTNVWYLKYCISQSGIVILIKIHQ